MKTMTSVHEAKNKLSEYLRQAQDGPVLITSHGKPVGILVGVDVEGMDEVLMGPQSAAFWDELDGLMMRANPSIAKSIVASRASKAPTRSLAAVRADTAALAREETRLGREMTREERKRFLSARRSKG
jgi:prevent-host-death family protein